MSSIQEAIRFYAKNPRRFIEEQIGVKPTKQQIEVLDRIVPALESHKGISVKSGHSVGKTSCEAWIILWFMVCYPNCKILCTAPTQHQLYDVLWAELLKWHKQCKFNSLFEWTKTHYRHINPKLGGGWFAVAQTSNKPEGLSGMHEENLLIIIDEASGIEIGVIEEIEGMLTQKNNMLIMFGNPTQITGAFHDSFHSKRPFYEVFTFSSIEAAKDNPQICDPRYATNLAAKYGIDTDIYRVRVLGEFPKAEPDTIISLAVVEKAASREINGTGTEIEIGVDVAAFGDDESVIVVRQGMKILEMKCFHKQDTMTTVGRIMQIREKYKVFTARINIDETGMGQGVLDRVRELKPATSVIYGIHNGSKPRNQIKYVNKGTELWFGIRERIQEMDIPNDEDLIAQLSTRKHKLMSSGKSMAEPKSDMKRRGLRSPDRADALILACVSLIEGMSHRRRTLEIF